MKARNEKESVKCQTELNIYEKLLNNSIVIPKTFIILQVDSKITLNRNYSIKKCR